jgi:hypothetical protein
MLDVFGAESGRERKRRKRAKGASKAFSLRAGCAATKYSPKPVPSPGFSKLRDRVMGYA